MALHKAKEFTGRVEVDGNAYVACVFEDVVLVYSGGTPPSFAGCVFRNWKFAFEGPAGNTVNFLKSLAPKQSGLSDVIRETFPEVAQPPARPAPPEAPPQPLRH